MLRAPIRTEGRKPQDRPLAQNEGQRSRLPRLSAAFTAVLFALLLAPAQPAAAQIGFGAPTTVSVRAQAQQTEARPGDSFAIAVVLDHEPGFHTWPDRAQLVIPEELGSDFPAIDTAVEVSAVSGGLQVGAVQYPATSEVPVDYFLTGNSTMLVSFTGQAVAYLPVSAAADASPGPAQVDFSLIYQACDETSCYPPETLSFSIPIKIVAAGASVAGAASDPIFDGFSGLDGASAAQAASCQPLTTNVFGRSFSFLPCGATGFLLLLLIAALGGLLLNFTPCVLPVLPLKIMGMSQAAGDPKRLVLLGAFMSLGVVSFWMGIGGAIAFVSGFSAISSLFQTSWFSLVVGLVVALMAVGMLGFFEIRLPQAIYKFNPSHDSLHGSFLFGIMTAVLSTPCTAPFMGSAAAWAATRDPAVTLATFGAIGAGMALPYLMLSLRPGLLNRMPRSGPGSVLVKQVMGLFMLSVASFFIGIPLAGWLQTPPDPASRGYWWLVLAFILIAAGWMVYRGLAMTPSTGKRIAVAGLGALIAGVGLLLTPGLASHGPIEWVYYTPERLEQAGAEGKVVVLDFTAEWCLNCKALEAGVLHQAPIVDLLAEPNVLPMKVDLTGDNPEGRAILQQLDWVGIPLLAVFGPETGYEQTPLKYDSYTIDTILKAVAEAG
jgi:thiol:disulfide interchange protein DsbD